jgi:thioredoxin reductase
VAYGEPTPVAEAPVEVDGLCRTSTPGVFAAGDLVAQMPQVAAAVAAGSLAATAVVQSLSSDDYGLPVPKWREHVNA